MAITRTIQTVLTTTLLLPAWPLAGIDRAIANRYKYNISVVNLGLATDSFDSYTTNQYAVRLLPALWWS